MLFRCREDLTDKMFMLILLLVVILLLSLLLRFFLLAFSSCSICWQNVIVSDVVRISLLTKCFARPVKPPIGACLLPEFLAGSPFFKPQYLISHHSIKPAGEKGAANHLWRYWPNFQLNSCHFVSNIENSIKRPENGQTIVGIYLIHPEDRRSVKSGGIFLGKSKFHSVPHVISSNRNWRFEKWLNLFCCSRHSEPKFAQICMKPWNIDICQLWKMSKKIKVSAFWNIGHRWCFGGWWTI